MEQVMDSIPYLRNHTTLFTSSLVGFTVVEWLGRYLFHSIPSYKHDKKQFNCHLVALLHSVIVIIPCLYLYYHEPLDRFQIFDYHPLIGQLHALSMGYFVWDSITSIQLGDVAFTFHGLACLIMMTSSFKPLLMNFGYKFLLFELSTPFVNINWFMDRIPGWKNTKSYYVNGVTLILTFFVARIIIGSKLTYEMFQSMTYNRAALSNASIYTYLSGTIILTSLNYYWFYLMIKKVRRALSR